MGPETPEASPPRVRMPLTLHGQHLEHLPMVTATGDDVAHGRQALARAPIIGAVPPMPERPAHAALDV